MDGGTILVVGGTGMLGERVVRRLGDDGFGVRVLARDPAQARGRLGAGVKVIAGDVEDAGSVERALGGCMGVHVSLGSGPGRRRRSGSSTWGRRGWRSRRRGRRFPG